MSIFTALENSIFITSVFHQLIHHDPQSHKYLSKCRISFNDAVGKEYFHLYPSRFLAETPLLSEKTDKRKSRSLITCISSVSMGIHTGKFRNPPK